MKGEMPINLENMNEFSRDRLNVALKEKDYKRAAIHLMPYVEELTTCI